MRVSEKFGKLIQDIRGDDSFGQASLKTHISKAYLIEIERGKIPSRSVIEQFARGYANHNPDLHALLVASGYITPTEDEIYSVQNIIAYLKRSEQLAKEDLEMLKKEIELLLESQK